MPAYLIFNIRVNDADAYAAVDKETGATLSAFGGKYIINGKPVEEVENQWPYAPLSVIEFPDRQKAMAWYNSPAYASLKAARQKATQTNLLLEEGFDSTIPGL